MKVEKAVERLGNILPIKVILDSLDKTSANIYLAVVNCFYDKGRAPMLEELRQINDSAAEIVKQLEQKDMLTLDEDSQVKGCYPFTMEPREHRIQLNGNEVHAMCALDALAPSSMFDCPSVVLSECAVTKDPVGVGLDKQTILNPQDVKDLHFAINWAAASSCGSCSESLCTEMMFLRDSDIAEDWQQQDPDNREIFNLPDSISFAGTFFKPMMHQG